MILADAQGLVSALMALGYDAWATRVDANTWQVQTQAPGAIDQQTVAAFAAQHAAQVAAYNVTTAASFR